MQLVAARGREKTTKPAPNKEYGLRINRLAGYCSAAYSVSATLVELAGF